MVTKKAAATTLDPKVFDFTSLMGKVKKPQPRKVTIWLAQGLRDRIEELDEQIDALDKARATLVGIDDDDPAAALWDERQALATEFNESAVEFTFRPIVQGDRGKIRAAMTEAGVDPDPDDFADVWSNFAVAQVCTSTEWTGPQVADFRDEVGEFAFLPLANEVVMMFNGAGVRSAPFSLKPSPSRTSGM